MSRKTSTIIIQFPVEIEFDENSQRAISNVIRGICHKYEQENRDKVMWCFGVGFAPSWRSIHSDGPLEFSPHFSFDISVKDSDSQRCSVCGASASLALRMTEISRVWEFRCNDCYQRLAVAPVEKMYIWEWEKSAYSIPEPSQPAKGEKDD